MSIQRWTHWDDAMGGMEKDNDGMYVLYADHVAAIAGAEQRARLAERMEYGDAFLRGVQAARDAVAALCIAEWHTRPWGDCICGELRACEARVRKEVATPTWSYGVGREAGIELARDAVAALPHDTYCATRDENYRRPCNCPVDDALAAIDALRGES